MTAVVQILFGPIGLILSNRKIYLEELPTGKNHNRPVMITHNAFVGEEKPREYEDQILNPKTEILPVRSQSRKSPSTIPP